MSSRAFDITATLFLAIMLIGSSALALDSASDADEEEAQPVQVASADPAESDAAASATGASSSPPQHTSSEADPEPPHGPSSKTTPPGHKAGAAKKGGSLAEAATDPSAILAQMASFFWTENSRDNRLLANTYLFQPVLPLTSSNVLRPALPVVTTGGMDGVSGIGDLFLLDVHIGHLNSGSWGVGGVATLPTATEHSLGAGKWSAGPMLMYMYKGVPKNIFGILGYNQWSFAGESDRDKVNVLSFQPIWVGHTSWGYLGWTDQLATVNWENNDVSFPVGLRIGKVWMASVPLNFAIEPYYTFRNHGREGTWGFKVNLTLIMPNLLQH